MKRFIFSIFFTAFLVLSACISISSKVKTKCNCLKGWAAVTGKASTSDINEDGDSDTQTSTFLPTDAWNAKMMIW